MANWYYVIGDRSFSYLTQEEKEYNAGLLASILRTKGWTDIAIAGLLGNISYEGILNPGQCEVGEGIPTGNNDTNYSGGLGLIQWTKPQAGNYNPLLKFANDSNVSWYDGNLQAEYIDHCDDSLNYGLWGWIQTQTYPISFSSFKSLNTTPSNASSIWLYNVERPGSPSQSESQRAQSAEDWYTYLQTVHYEPRLTMGDIYTSPYYTIWDAYYPEYQMPNCTCYTFGRLNELSNIQHLHYDFPTGNGCDWYPQGIAKGFQSGMIPQLGAVACWWYTDSSGNPSGHCAVVEQIYYDSNNNPISFVTSNSAWNRDSGWNHPRNEFPWFYLETVSMSNLDFRYNHPEAYFQGFLYNKNGIAPPLPPAPTPPPTPTPPYTGTKMPFLLYLKRIL